MKTKWHAFLRGWPLLVALMAFGATAASTDVRVWGNFGRLMHTGDASAQVVLADAGIGRGDYGVGALAQMRGEIWVWDGRVLVSRGHDEDGRTEPPRDGDAAALLAVVRVGGWREVPVPRDLPQPEFERFVLEQAQAHRIDVERPFAFAVRGPVTALTWHVVTGTASAAHGTRHALGHAASRRFTAARTDGVLLGLYSASALEGVVSHPGERFHVHFATSDDARSGHVDAYAVAAGAVLLLPVPQ